MPRPLDNLQTATSDAATTKRELAVTGRTGRSFAAAVSVLLLATLVVNRSGAALIGDPATSAAVVNSGTIELSDDDQGRALFDIDDITPVRPAVQCIEVTYNGTILPVALRLRAEADGALADYLDIAIDEGVGGGYDSCAGFVPAAPVFDDALDVLTELGWVELGNLVNVGDTRGYRIELTLHDRQEALAQATGLEITWEVVPS